MPRATVEEHNPYRFEENTYYKVALLECEEKRYPRKDPEKQRQFGDVVFWEWAFKVVDGENAGLHLYLKTDPGVTTGESDKARRAIEALIQTQLNLSDGVDTSDYVGLECWVTITHEEYTRTDGSKGYKEPIQDLFSLEMEAPGHVKVDTTDSGGKPPF